MDKVKELMRSGAITEAAELLKAHLAEFPQDVEAKVLYGTCCRLLGDEETFLKIDDELTAVAAPRPSKMISRYHALRMAACGAVLLFAGEASVMAAPSPAYGIGSYQGPMTIYGGGSYMMKSLRAPKPSASDGKYSDCVLVKWRNVTGAAYYEVRRGTTPGYWNSVTITTTTGLSFRDYDARCSPNRKFYYWIVPHDWFDTGYPKMTTLDKGHVKQALSLHPSCESVNVGSSMSFTVAGNGCSPIPVSACKWKVSSKSKADISPTGVLVARKSGTVTVTATYNGAKAKFKIKILKSSGQPCYGVACYVPDREIAVPACDIVVLPLRREEEESVRA